MKGFLKRFKGKLGIHSKGKDYSIIILGFREKRENNNK